MANEKRQNKMGVLPVPKLLINMGAPMMLSMLGQALYNVVDTYFVSHIPDTAAIASYGDKAINALTLAFPVQMLITALGVGTGVGTNAMLSRNLGRGDRERASKTAGNAMLAAICYCVLIFLFGLAGAEPFISSQTADPVIKALGTQYLQIVCLLSFGTIGFMCLEKVVMATGNTTVTMIAQMAGAVTNIILDPVMIYGLLGLPAMGVAGAAWATVIGQFVSLAVIALIHFTKCTAIDSGVKYLKPDLSVLRDIYSVGSPAIVMQILNPVLTYLLNIILGSVSASMVTAYGVYSKLQNFIFMPAFGLNNASIPIISFNFGAKLKNRVKDAVKYAVIYVCGIMVVGFILLQVFASSITGLFAVSAQSAALCELALHIITCGFIFGGLNVVLQGVCQALGNGVYSLIITALRTVALVLPLAYIFSRSANAETLVWFSLPIAEAGAFIAAVFLTVNIYRKRVSPLPEQ